MIRKASLSGTSISVATAAILAACGAGAQISSDGTFNPDGGGLCPSPILPDPLSDQRKACTFAAGASVADTLGISEARRASIPIKNIIVLMKENRSFDHLLGALHIDGQPEVEAIPAGFANNDLKGMPVATSHAPTTCIPHDADHQWASMHIQSNGGAMDGFVKSAAMSTGTDGHFVMSYYEQADLPFYYWIANTFALSDRHFPSELSGTFPNRNFLMLGTADGIQSTGSGFPNPKTPSIFDLLDKAGVTWGVYTNSSWVTGTLNWPEVHKGCHKFPVFTQSLDDGTLPQVAFVDGTEYIEDEHPSADVQFGEAWTHGVYQHAMTSKLWPGMAIIWTYDEGGGFFDHVPPPTDACVARPIASDKEFHELGVRVPLAVISPFARPHFVSHVVQDHTAITRFIETVFNLPALTARDANSGALLDMFDFNCPAFLTPPQPVPSGTGGCTNIVVLGTSKPDYAKGESIVINFTGAPGMDATDWIAVYPYGPSGPTPPQPGELLWVYVGGGQSPGGKPKSGSVTLDATTVGMGKTWPLPAGGYIGYYLLSHRYLPYSSIDFSVK